MCTMPCSLLRVLVVCAIAPTSSRPPGVMELRAPLHTPRVAETAQGAGRNVRTLTAADQITADVKLVNAGPGWSGTSKGKIFVVLPNGTVLGMAGEDDCVVRNHITACYNDVWASNNQGLSWTRSTSSAPWGARSSFGVVALRDGTVVLMGGRAKEGLYKNDIWSCSDGGMFWSLGSASASWSGRFSFASVSLSSDAILIMGGFGHGPLRDIWKSRDRGSTWTSVSSFAPWSARYDHVAVVLPDDGVLVMAGWSDKYNRDVWRSEPAEYNRVKYNHGLNWTRLSEPAWLGRTGPSAIVMRNGDILLMGGCVHVASGCSRGTGDMWHSADRGESWKQVTRSLAWPMGEFGHLRAVAEPNGSALLMMHAHHAGTQPSVWQLNCVAAYPSCVPRTTSLRLIAVVIATTTTTTTTLAASTMGTNPTTTRTRLTVSLTRTTTQSYTASTLAIATAPFTERYGHASHASRHFLLVSATTVLASLR